MKTLRSIVLFVLFLSSGYLYAADHGGQVTDTKFNYRNYNDSAYVFTIGHIQNSGKYPLEDIVIEVQFFDKNDLDSWGLDDVDFGKY